MESLSTAQAVLIGKKRFDIAARQTILTSLVSATAVIAAIVLTRNPLWIIGAYLGATLIGRLITFLVSRQFIENTIVSKENLRFGMHMSAVAVLGIIAGNVDMFLLWHTATAQTLALYAFALATVSPFQSLIKTILNLVQPKFATQTPDQLRSTVPRRAHQTLLLLIPMIVAAIIALPWLYQILFPNYAAAVPFAQVLMLSAALYSEKFYGIALVTMRQTEAMYTINTINTAVKIGLLAVLIPLFGGWGAVAAILAQNMIAILVTRFFFYRHVR
jgi:O-antigen/teichoic acid export membrane protein